MSPLDSSSRSTRGLCERYRCIQRDPLARATSPHGVLLRPKRRASTRTASTIPRAVASLGHPRSRSALQRPPALLANARLKTQDRPAGLAATQAWINAATFGLCVMYHGGDYRAATLTLKDERRLSRFPSRLAKIHMHRARAAHSTRQRRVDRHARLPGACAGRDLRQRHQPDRIGHCHRHQ
jgi:hypothetical protein